MPVRSTLRRSLLTITAATFLFVGRQQSNFLVQAGNTKDHHEDCAKWAEEGQCRTNMEYMLRTCPASCEKQPGIRKAVDIQHIREGDPSFFDLTAKTIDGKTMDFDRFEGYVTVVANAARECGGVTLKGYESLEHLHSIYPYTLEILVFPFYVSKSKRGEQCIDEIKEAEKQKEWKIHIMEEVEINGPNTHPVYQYLKERFGMNELEEYIATYFLITPDGNMIEAHHGSSALQLQRYVEKHLKEDLDDIKKYL